MFFVLLPGAKTKKKKRRKEKYQKKNLTGVDRSTGGILVSFLFFFLFKRGFNLHLNTGFNVWEHKQARSV